MSQLPFDQAREYLTMANDPLKVITVVNFLDVLEKLDQARIITVMNCLIPAHHRLRDRSRYIKLICKTPDRCFKLDIDMIWTDTDGVPEIHVYNSPNTGGFFISIGTSEDEILTELFNYFDWLLRFKRSQ